jgi:hypothetical protein
MLRDRYGVPAGGMECAPQWLIANVRPGGPPPDSQSLNLDLGRLDLSCRGDQNRTARLSGITPGPDAPQIPPDALTSKAAVAYVNQETRGSSEGEIRAAGRECLPLRVTAINGEVGISSS